jgi:hypothetical protein
VDFAPTFLKLLGIPIPPSAKGRPLDEALLGGKALARGTVKTVVHTTSTADGTYRLTGTFSTVSVGGQVYRYFDGTKVVRK